LDKICWDKCNDLGIFVIAIYPFKTGGKQSAADHYFIAKNVTGISSPRFKIDYQLQGAEKYLKSKDEVLNEC